MSGPTKADLLEKIEELEKQLAAKPKGGVDHPKLEIVYKKYPAAAQAIAAAIK